MSDINEVITRNPNEIRDTIFHCLSLSEYTKVPVLFLGSPGIAKTTNIRTWAEINGYKVTTLIGTQRVAEEILGYMVNDTESKRLVTYTPDWFDEILENARLGFKTLLFIDELSQAADNVQGAMLQLIFDRRVGGRANYLPDNCLVVSAANYKGNIPVQCGIQAATLNRFCIINLEPSDNLSIVTEFLQSDSDRAQNIPMYKIHEITSEMEETCRKNMFDIFSNLIASESKNAENSDSASINFKNQQFNEIFDQPGPVYNFLSGRTIHYLWKMCLGLIHFDIIRKINRGIITNVVLGLGGLGTNSFKNEQSAKDFQISLVNGFTKVIRTVVNAHKNEINSAELDFSGKSIEKNISDWIRFSESSSILTDKNITNLIIKIEKEYPTNTSGMSKVIRNWSNQKLNDLHKIDTLASHLAAYDLADIAPWVKRVNTVSYAYKAYKAAALEELVNK